MNYSLTHDAVEDILQIERFTESNWGKDQVKKYLSEINSIFNLLVTNPKMGVCRPELGNNFYSYPARSHMIYYKLHQEYVVIFAILHKNMVPAIHLEKRDY